MGSSQKKAALSKREILKGYGSFDPVFRNGKSLQKSHTILFYLEADEKKIGFVVSRQVRKAVQRNRLKRKLREIYRLNKNNFPDKYHYVLLARGTNYNFHVLEKEILESVSEIRHADSKN